MKLFKHYCGWTILFLLLITCLLFNCSNEAVEKRDSIPVEERTQAITQLIDAYVRAREARDTALLSSILTADMDQLTSSGNWRYGQAAAIQGMQRSSTNNPGKRTITVENIRLLNGEAAMADTRYEIENADGSIRKMWSTFIVQQENQHWKIAAIRNMLPTGN